MCQNGSVLSLSPPSPLVSPLSLSSLSHLVGEDVDPLLQVSVLGVQQRRLFALEGAVGVRVLPKLADHRELKEQ